MQYVLEGYNLLNDDKMLRNVLLGNIIMYGQFRSSSIVKHIPFMVAESHLIWTPRIVNYTFIAHCKINNSFGGAVHFCRIGLCLPVAELWNLKA